MLDGDRGGQSTDEVNFSSPVEENFFVVLRCLLLVLAMLAFPALGPAVRVVVVMLRFGIFGG